MTPESGVPPIGRPPSCLKQDGIHIMPRLELFGHKAQTHPLTLLEALGQVYPSQVGKVLIGTVWLTATFFQIDRRRGTAGLFVQSRCYPKPLRKTSAAIRCFCGNRGLR